MASSVASHRRWLLSIVASPASPSAFAPRVLPIMVCSSIAFVLLFAAFPAAGHQGCSDTITTSTLLFFVLPSGVSLEATGLYWAYPEAENLAGASPHSFIK